MGVNTHSKYISVSHGRNRIYLCLGEQESGDNVSERDPGENPRDSQVPGGNLG